MMYEVILDTHEKANKCTIAPLLGRADFHFFRVKGETPLGPLKSTVLLHHEGKCITTLRTDLKNIQGIAAVDCVWRRLDPLIGRIISPLPIFARIPNGFKTAYPRRSKDNSDPEVGLATIEAIFSAAAILGHWDVSLFSEYSFGRKFVEINIGKFLELGVDQVNHPELFPVFQAKRKTSQQRRLIRGKMIYKYK